jgi:DNA polymerase III sliding clamp (beta) subunit (PCNA family)
MLSQTARLAFQDGRKFTSILDAIASVADEVDVVLDDKGLTVHEMDPSRVAMVTLTMSKAAMEEFNLGGETKLRFRISISDFKKLKLKAQPVTFTFDLKDNKCLVQQEKPYTRTFNLRLLKSEGEEIPPLKVDFDVTAKMTLSVVRSIIEDARLCADHVTIRALPGKLCFNNRGDLLTYDAEIVEGSEALLEFSLKQEAKAIFSIKYFDDVTKSALDIGKIAQLRLKKDFPILIEIQPEDPNLLSLSYALAPRIESE